VNQVEILRVDGHALQDGRHSANDDESNVMAGEDFNQPENPSDAISGALKRRITAGVSAGAPTVVRAIDLDHETLRGSQEVRDETPEQRHLPAKHDAEPPPANALPEELLGCRL
jgi:hypothetical protein